MPNDSAPQGEIILCGVPLPNGATCREPALHDGPHNAMPTQQRSSRMPPDWCAVCQGTVTLPHVHFNDAYNKEHARICQTPRCGRAGAIQLEGGGWLCQSCVREAALECAQQSAVVRRPSVPSGKKIVISFDGVRRELQMPFRICCDRETLQEIRKCIGDRLCDTTWSYGWHDIFVQPASGPSNTPPLSWKEDGNDYGK